MSIWNRDGDHVTTIESTSSVSADGTTGVQKLSHSLHALSQSGYQPLRLVYRSSPQYRHFRSLQGTTSPEIAPNASDVPNQDTPNTAVSRPPILEKRPAVLLPDSIRTLPASPAAPKTRDLQGPSTTVLNGISGRQRSIPGSTSSESSERKPALPDQTVSVRSKNNFVTKPRYVLIDKHRIEVPLLYIQQKTLFVPIRPLLEHSHVQVTYRRYSRLPHAASQALFRGKHLQGSITVGRLTVTVNGQHYRLDHAPRKLHARMIVPISFLSGILKWNVSYDAAQRTLRIATDKL
jgi:hypothetical protein